MIDLLGQNAVWVLLAACAVMIALFLKYDRRAYERFKLLTATADRQRHFCYWIIEAALLFGGGALLGLSVLGRLPALSGRGMPAEFTPIAKAVPSIPIAEHVSEFLVGAGIGLCIGAVGLIVVLRFMKKKGAPAKTLTLGDIEPILPRNNAERVWAALIALNAGWSEELFFRLLLPLLLTLATGNVVIAFAVAIAIFGIVHLYQGVAGIFATALLGAVFAGIYLATGNIWIAAAVHAFVDLNGLLLQPLLRGALTKPRA